MTAQSRKKKTDGSVFDIFNFGIMLILSFITLFPFYYVLIVSFARYEDVTKKAIYIFPTAFDFSAYTVIFSSSYILNSFMISIFVTVVGTILSMAVSVAGAYAWSKSDLPGIKIISALLIFTMFFSGGLIPYYLTVKALGMVNSVLVMIIPLAVNTFYVILLRNFFQAMPPSIEESAKIDGANEIYILYKIIIPTAAPVLATISLFYAVDRWNDYYQALLFISEKKFYPLQMILREVILDFGQMMGSSMGREIAGSRRFVYTKSVQMAVVTVTTIPILLVYPYLQKHFTKGIMFGAVKE